MPRIATSGALTIGVKYVPPMPPRLLMVKRSALHLVERQLARLRLLGDLLQLRRELHDVLLVHVADHRHEQAGLGVDRDADVDVLLEDDLFVRNVDGRIELREYLERRRDDFQRQWR